MPVVTRQQCSPNGGLISKAEVLGNVGLHPVDRVGTAPFLTLPARPFQAWPIHAELHEAHHFRLGHVGGATIFAPEKNVRRMRYSAHQN